MARIATGAVTKSEIQNSTYTYAADAEASDAYAIALASAPSAYAEGQSFAFKANTANTGASSLNVNGLGAKTLKKLTDQDTETGDIESGSIVEVVYDGTNFQIVSVSAVTPLEALNPTALKTANYTAAVNDIVKCDATTNTFVVTLPTAPADGSIIKVIIAKSGAGVVEVACGGSDTFNTTTGPTSNYLDLQLSTLDLQYDSANTLWTTISTAAPVNFANNNPGIDASTPITAADISIDTGTRVLTITPPLGYFNVLIDGAGTSKRYRKTTVNFPAFTDTSGVWYFYFDADGVAVTTQTPWTTDAFPEIATIYRIRWNATEAGADKLVDEFVEYHKNDIPGDTHQWMHLYGAIWASGATMVNNAITSGSPNADGRNTGIGLTTAKILDDNLEYTVTNDATPTEDWEQDLGEESAGSLTTSNSGQFKQYVQDGSGLITYLDATRFPFSFSGSNIMEYITSTGTRTEVTNNYFAVMFVYATQHPRTGEAIRIVSATEDFATITGARAYNWSDIQNTYTELGTDGEIRPLYRLIYEKKSIYDVATKYAALRETQDIRKAAVTSTTAATGTLPASSVTVVPAGDIASTNAQAAIEELDTEKAGAATTMTFTNKRITTRVSTEASSATPTINTDNVNAHSITALAAAITSMTTNLSGTPTNFQPLIIRILDDGTNRAITWGASFIAKGVDLPTTTTASKLLTVGFVYDTVISKWGCIASVEEA